MSTRRVTRRDFLRLSAMAAAGIVSAACATPTPEIVEKEVTKVVEKEVTKEVEKEVTRVVKEEVTVETEVEKIVTPTPVSSGQEAPVLGAKVAGGELPPLDERLPPAPLEVPVVEEVGQYGGTWRRTYLRINSWGRRQDGRDNLLAYTKDGGTVEPSLAEGWEVADEGRVYTFSLRKGVKWSDGEPFTADDVLYHFEDVLGNDELTPVYPKSLIVADERIKVEKIDDYTVRFSFVAPYGLFVYMNFAGSTPKFDPKHYASQLHPKYASPEALQQMAEDLGFEAWSQLYDSKLGNFWWNTNPDRPCITTWDLTVPAPATRMTTDRNPYYWKIDPEGNQLPYIDRIVYDLTQDTEVLNLKAMAGELDFQGWNISTGNYSLFMENREEGDYRVLQWSDTYGSNPMVFLNLTVADSVLREVFEDVRFRQALSLAINRAEINEFAYMGMGIPRQASLVRGSAYYSEEWTQNYAEYDPDRANELLDEIGLTERDGDGYRLRRDGQTLSFTLDFYANFDNYPDVVEFVQEYWQAVGLDVSVKNYERSLYSDRWGTNDWQAGTWTQPGLTVLFNNWWFLNNYGDWGNLYGQYYQSDGESGEEPPADMLRLWESWAEIQVTADEEARNALIQEGIDLHIKNVWLIGIVGDLPKLVIVKNRMRNVPEWLIFDNSLGCPQNADPEQFFFTE